jgi:cysteine desulfurase / selenocysteine lyase
MELRVTRRDLGRLVTGVLAVDTTSPGSGRTAASRALSPVHRWRQQLPALAHSVVGERLVYLDSAATTQRPKAVLEALTNFYCRDNASPGKTQHTLARRAYERYEEARAVLARFLNAAGTEEVVWVLGTTEAINLVATTWGQAPSVRVMRFS